MSDLPLGWVWADLSQVCASIADGDHQPPPQTPSGIPFLVIGNIRGRRLDFSGCRYVSKEYYDSLKSIRRPQKGDVLYSLVGSYGISALVRENDPFCVQRHIGIIRPSPQVSAPFLAHVLSSPDVYDQATSCATGTAQLTVPLAGLRRIRVPIPPRGEQDRIVVAIEEQFSRLDAGIAAVERIRLDLRRMRTAVNDAAVTGRLVPQTRDKVATENLMARLRNEAARCGKSNATAPDIQNFTSVPDSWQIVPLTALAESIDYGTSEKSRSEPEGLPVLRMGNLGRGKIAYDDLKFLPRGKIVDRLLLKPGDLLFNRTNSAELVGKTAVFHGYREDITFASYLIRVRPLPSADLEWASIVLNSTMGRRYVAEVRTQQVGQANVNGTKLAAAPIPLPSADEQSRIIAERERILSVIDSLENAVIAALKRGEKLRLSILSSAFTGNLVPRSEETAV